VDEQHPGGTVWRSRQDNAVTVHMPIENVRRGRKPMLIVTAHRDTGCITARIALDVWHDTPSVPRE
jgi:hypothetical protein